YRYVVCVIRDSTEPEEDDAEDQGAADVVDRQLDVSDPKRQAVEIAGELVEPAEDVQGGERNPDPFQQAGDQPVADEPGDDSVEEEDDGEALGDANEPGRILERHDGVYRDPERQHV